MPHDNRISAALPGADKAAILTKLQEIRALLPFLVNLTPDERKSLGAIGTARAGMDDAFLQAMTAHPELAPSFVNLDEVNKDRTLRQDISPILQAAAELCEGVGDTTALAAHDNYLAYLSFYTNVKEAARRGVPGADTILSNLARFFPRGSRAAAPPTPPANP